MGGDVVRLSPLRSWFREGNLLYAKSHLVSRSEPSVCGVNYFGMQLVCIRPAVVTPRNQVFLRSRFRGCASFCLAKFRSVGCIVLRSNLPQSYECIPTSRKLGYTSRF